MKVKAFLNRMMMSSSVDTVRIAKNGHIMAEYDEADLRSQDYGAFGELAVKTFCVHDKVLVINI